MRKEIGIILLALLLLIPHISAEAKEYEEKPYMYKARATAYVLTGKTASGSDVRHGICASGRKEWMGKTLIIYSRISDDINEFIGIYECVDTGCAKEVIDVWCDGMDEAQEFMDLVYQDGCQGKIWVQVIDAEG